jgi:hypothetical protein
LPRPHPVTSPRARCNNKSGRARCRGILNARIIAIIETKSDALVIKASKRSPRAQRAPRPKNEKIGCDLAGRLVFGLRAARRRASKRAPHHHLLAIHRTEHTGNQLIAISQCCAVVETELRRGKLPGLSTLDDCFGITL